MYTLQPKGKCKQQQMCLYIYRADEYEIALYLPVECSDQSNFTMVIWLLIEIKFFDLFVETYVPYLVVC